LIFNKGSDEARNVNVLVKAQIKAISLLIIIILTVIVMTIIVLKNRILLLGVVNRLLVGN